jgi:hypothetical protein
MASFIIGLFFAFNVEQTAVLNDEQKAPLNGFIDWDNSIYIIVKSDQVSYNL